MNDDNLAMELYKNSNLSEKLYFKAMTACAICGYIKTVSKVFEERRTNKCKEDSLARDAVEFI